MSLDKHNRAALIIELETAIYELNTKIEVYKELCRKTSAASSAWQLVLIEATKVKIKIIKEAIINNEIINDEMPQI
jgi:hypothetical protein